MQATDMMQEGKPFLHPDFLLESKLASELYHDVAADMPIIDYHNHLSPADVANNRRFGNMTEIWLHGDHYKWRAMRANGINEAFITGKSSDQEKFRHWAATVPRTLRNPLYHWSHLELLNPFGINELLNAANADAVYNRCNEVLKDFPVQTLLDHYKVSWLCTTDHPLDDLAFHQKAEAAIPGKMLPGFRPDALLDFSTPLKFTASKEGLEKATGKGIRNLADYMDAFLQRVQYFHDNGCRISDHGFGAMPQLANDAAGLDKAFTQSYEGKTISADQADQLRGLILLELCRKYHQLGWVQQFHVGAIRNNNTRLGTLLGADAGTDSIHDLPQAERMSAFLNQLDTTNQLARTVIYNLNPADNAVFATMAGNFQDGSIPGKIQWGAAWWFLDQKDGMEEQFKVLSNMGLASRFIGMLTDSRSFLSFSRHEYFRRILCNLLADDVLKGLIPSDKKMLKELIRGICYENAREYFSKD